MSTRKPITFDQFIRVLSGILIVGIIFSLIYFLRGVLQPFFIAGLLAYLIFPIVQFLQWRPGNRYRLFSIILTLSILISVGIILWIILVPAIQKEAYKFATLTNQYAQELDLPSYFPEKFTDKISAFLLSDELKNLLSGENIREALGYIREGFEQTFSGIFGILGGLITIVVILLYLVFILVDYESISEGWKSLIPPKYRPKITRIAKDLTIGMEAYFRAQTKIVLTVSVLFALGFKIIGLPLGIALGIFVGLLNYIPYLQIAGFIPAFFLGILKSMETDTNLFINIGLIFLVFAIVQAIQDAFLTPRVMGKLTGLNPAIILLALSVWGSLLGIIGMIIALPLTTLLLSYYKNFIKEPEKEEEETIEN